MADPAAHPDDPDDVQLNVGVLGNINRVTVKRGTTVGQALQQSGFGTDLEQYNIRGWLRGGNKSRDFKTDEFIEEDMTLLLLRPIVGRAPEIAKRVIKEKLPAGVSEVWTERTVDSESADAMRVVIILKPRGAGAITGDAALDALVQLQNRLHEEAENLPIIVDYATKQEIEESGGS